MGPALAVVSVAGVLFACIPHPKDDFEDYTDRTGSFRPTNTPKDAEIPDTAPPTMAVEATYFGACLSQLAAGRIDRVLRFYTETKFTPDASGGTGKLTLKIPAMKLGPNSGPPASFSKSENVGMTFAVNDQPVDAKGVYPADLGTVSIPGSSNPISGRDIVIENVKLPGRFAAKRFCSQLSGDVKQPTEITLTPSANTCIFQEAKDGDPLPAITVADFENGCPL